MRRESSGDAGARALSLVLRGRQVLPHDAAGRVATQRR